MCRAPTCPGPLLLCAQGPTYSVTVNGGECEILDDGSVECEEPFVELSETPFICNLPYRKAAKLEVRAWRGVQGLESAVLGRWARCGCQQSTHWGLVIAVDLL